MNDMKANLKKAGKRIMTQAHSQESFSVRVCLMKICHQWRNAARSHWVCQHKNIIIERCMCICMHMYMYKVMCYIIN